MSFDPDNHHRRSARLRGCDYRGVGAYFVTVCSANSHCVFGRPEGNSIRLHPYGRIVNHEWEQTALIRKRVELDIWVVMPNHFHALLWFIEPPIPISEPDGATLWRPPDSLGSLMGGWEGRVTSQINQYRQERNWGEVAVWQRNYYDHIIRDDRELALIREYIFNNPANWLLDVECKM